MMQHAVEAGTPLQEAEQMAGVKLNPSSWATPTGDDANNATRQSGAFQSLTRQAGKLNPDWVETLMGLPIGWTQLPHKFVKPRTAPTDSKRSATASCPPPPSPSPSLSDAS
jgi:hypothetical protein